MNYKEIVSKLELKMADLQQGHDINKKDTLSRYHKILSLARSILDIQDLIDLSEQDHDNDSIKAFELELKQLENDYKDSLIIPDIDDDKRAILEIRPAAGGEESSLFAMELFKAYQKWLEKKNIKLEIMSENFSPSGGYKEIIARTNTPAYAILKYEAGVHRVQRVPATEASGRLHTSTVTVIVMPEYNEKEIVINQNDLRIDVFRSSGNGGQSVNTTDSAVRIVHIPTGTIVTCQDEKSQLKNKLKAMSVLYSRLKMMEKEKVDQEAGLSRLAQVGSGDRSEKIRTYNFPQDRVTDHRINKSFHNIDLIMAGALDDVYQALRQADIDDEFIN